MLALTRKDGEAVVIGPPENPIGTVRVISTAVGQAKLSFDFPADLPINREEIARQKCEIALEKHRDRKS